MSCYPDNNAMIAQAIRNYDNFRARGGRLFLLKRAGQTGKFSVILELTSGYFVNWDKYREQTQFLYATLDIDFVNVQAQASYIAYGVPDSNDEIDVYELKADARDRVPPDSSSPSWKLFGSRLANERFILPSDSNEFWNVELMTTVNGEAPVFDVDANFALSISGIFGIFKQIFNAFNCLIFHVPTTLNGSKLSIFDPTGEYFDAYGFTSDDSGKQVQVVKTGDTTFDIYLEGSLMISVNAVSLNDTVFYLGVTAALDEQILISPSGMCP